ncbi:hypothetical protein LP420_39560 [Massilia sp. B-10]|nr:hypothetical protein LP420_39560 [Massilia sp. B-10]
MDYLARKDTAMNRLPLLLLPIALLAAPLAADAQDWRDERSQRRLERGESEVFWEGNCRIERRLNRYGELMERRSCRGDRAAYARAAEREPEDSAPAADDPPDRGAPEPVYRAPP